MDEKEVSEMQEEMMTVLVVEPMKAPYVKSIPNELEDLQQAVGGDIEMTYPFEDEVGILLNGNGKFEGLPLNRALYDDRGQVYDAIAGTFLVVGLTEDDFTSLTPEQIEMIKKSAELNTAVLDHVAAHIHAGMSTAEIDKLVYDFTTEHGGIPAPLNYEGFPKSVCTSINNVICHGIPSENEILIDGDIINVDVSTILNGYFSDASRMFTIGDVSPEAERIVRVTKECVELGLKAAKPWGHLGDIAYAINSHAQENGYSVVEEIGGHGIGLEFHEEPFVSYVTPKGSEMVLVPGMMFTIEPMINQGSPEFYVDEDNGWTVYTDDDGLSAQIEYMVLIKEDGVEVLTK